MTIRPTLNVLKHLTPANHHLLNLSCSREHTGLVNKIQAKLLSSQPQELPNVQDTWLSKKMMNTRLRLGLCPRPHPYYRLRGLTLFQGVEAVDWKQYFKVFQMKDTFHSWFLVIELHMWMLNVRGARENKEGDLLKKYSLEYMWETALKRAKKLESYAPSAISKGFDDLHDELVAAFLLYDYGLLTSDVELAGALWFRFFKENCDDPEKIELLLKHVRKQVQTSILFTSLTSVLQLQLLEDMPKEEFVDRANVRWLPLSEKL
ncbi:Ubiquinol-cytochrome-c reductase complex assembly factor 1 [Frankliniella fusca]|uniref:Ubiquinol-cytochrome-c reductase complex assembly factor 1 n=1 Tax=Frankliniella fusca TaxID=407009 RepID=A0AAE1HUF3_9NEOP|nr:Ubiquinol-cytochrome-c reductase complex assembly factor 1 [Frankliniella fusca]